MPEATESALTLPPYLEPFRDARFESSVVRVTNPGKAITGLDLTWDSVAVHHYSIDQAWNADQSLLYISKGNEKAIFLDGASYEPAFARKKRNCRWHPDEPDLMVFASGEGVGYWDVRDDSKKIVSSLSNYEKVEIESKGNLSDDGSKVPLMATRKSDGHKVVFVYDLEAKKKYPDIDIHSWEDKNWITISPLGKYIICYPLVNESDENKKRLIFELDGTKVATWPEYERPGHGDFMFKDGKEYAVGRSKVEPDKMEMILRKLPGGEVTSFSPKALAQHTSARNNSLSGPKITPEWVFATFTEDDLSSSHLKCQNEIAAIKTDGSEAVKHLATHNSLKHNYDSEPHGCPSRDGKRAIFASNWGKAGGPVAAYVAEFD